MKILCFADLHGSLNSLLALAETDDFKNADKIIFLGDVAFGCSRPNECIDFIKGLKCDCIFGNNDKYIFDHVPKADLPEFDNVKIGQMKWMSNNISASNKKALSRWNKSLELLIGDKKFYFTHYAWEDYDNDINVVDTPLNLSLEARKQMFSGINADYYIFGHEHQSSYFTDGHKHYYCLGSLGLTNPGTYLVIEYDNGKIKIKEKFINFDINQEILLMDKAGYPYTKSKINN